MVGKLLRLLKQTMYVQSFCRRSVSEVDGSCSILESRVEETL